MQLAENKKFIDIDQAVKSKNPRLYQLLPGFILGYLKKLIRQKEMNAFVEVHGNKNALDFVSAILIEFSVRIEVNGIENIPLEGGCIMAANHPLGGLDAMALVEVTARKRKDIRFIVNDILLQLKNLTSIFVGVNKHGRNSAGAIQSIDAEYSSGSVIMIFPAGLVSRKKNGAIKDLEWKKSFITKARKHQLNVIPVYIGGRNTEKFYNLARLREQLGIKSNIEMVLLPAEMYHQKDQTISITFGKPISPQHFDRSRSDNEWANEIRELVYTLRPNKL